MRRLIAHVAALAVPAALFAWWASATRPWVLRDASTPLLVMLGIALVGAGIVARWLAPRLERERAAGALLFVLGALWTAGFWFRASRGARDLPTLDVVWLLGLGWWPAALIALAMWTLEQALARPGGWPRYWSRVSVGLLAGVVGVGVFVGDMKIRYRGFDRAALDEALGPVRRDFEGVVSTSGPSWSVRRGGDLTLEFKTGPAAAGLPYAALVALERGLTRARQLTDRADVARVTVVIRAPAGELVRFEARESDRRRPLLELARIDRALLRNGGRLDAESLAAMVTGPGPANRARWERWFAYGVDGEDVRVSFAPDRPLAPVTADLYSAAWASANAIVHETARYFPDVRRFLVAMPRLAATLGREEVGPDFRLQHRVGPPGRVLGLVARESDRGEETLDPAGFTARSPAGFQVAVVYHTAAHTHHVAGLLFERVGTLGFVVDLADDGRVTLIHGSGRLDSVMHAGLATGARTRLGRLTIRNLGWFPRAAFPGGAAPR